jgi:CBS domain-containing protein
MARRVADIIKGQKIATLRPSDSVRAACKVMAERNIGAVLVTDEDGRLLGIFTERDLLNRVAAPGLDFDKTLLREVMTKRPMSMHSTDSAIVALRRMRDGGYRHLPVVDGGELRGIVSSRDFLGAELRELEAEAAFKSALQDEGFRPGA